MMIYFWHYPFKNPLVREIEAGNYEAVFRVIDPGGRDRGVVFADDIDTKEEAEARLQYCTHEQLAMSANLQFDEKCIFYTLYDVTSNYDRAIVTLHKEQDGNLYTAAIYGRPIVLDLNRSCFMRDADGIANYGTAALNVTGSYFSEYEVQGVPQYEDWVRRELAERVQNSRETTIKTHRALFHARVGATIQLSMKNKELEIEGNITAFSLRYRRDRAFVATFKLHEK